MGSASNDDAFTSFLSAPASQAAVSGPGGPASSGGGGGSGRSADEDSFFNQPQAQATGGGKLTTDSILALYGKSQPTPAPQPINAFPLQGETIADMS